MSRIHSIIFNPKKITSKDHDIITIVMTIPNYRFDQLKLSEPQEHLNCLAHLPRVKL